MTYNASFDYPATSSLNGIGTTCRPSLAIPTVMLDEVDSTFLEAERQIEAGLNMATIICAKTQTKGRGRHNRSWFSPIGNLYWTLVLPKKLSWPKDHGLSFLAGLCTIDVIRAFGISKERLALKWPNDVLIDGKKVSGALVIGTSNVSFTPARDFALVGIGLNIIHFPTDTDYAATSLRDAGISNLSFDNVRDALSEAYLNRLPTWELDGFSAIRDSCERYLFGLGTKIRVSTDPSKQNFIQGTNLGMSPDGALRIEKENGEIYNLYSADVLPPLP